MKHRISIVAAMGHGKLHNRVLGKNNQLLWHIPDDLRRFKSLTLGHPVIMGRKTFESIVAVLKKPLPGRTNIIMTRDPRWQFAGVLTALSVEEAIELAKKQEGASEIFIGGGGQIYQQALRYVDKLYLTLIDDGKLGDSYFPAYESVFTEKTFEESREWNGIKYRWVDLERRRVSATQN